MRKATPKDARAHWWPWVADATIRSQLFLLVLASMLPLVLFAGYMVLRSYDQERHRLGQVLLDTARAPSLAVDRDLQAEVAGLQALALSRALQAGDLASFREQADAFKKLRPAANSVILADANGQQLINTLKPQGAILPARGSLEPVKQVFETGRPFISNVYTSSLLWEPVLSVDVPVLRDGEVVYDLAISLSPNSLLQLLAEQRVARDWTVVVFDRRGIIAARSQAAERFVGRPGRSELIALVARTDEGVYETESMERTPILVAFSKSQASGWSVAIGVPRANLNNALARSLGIIAIGGIALLLAGLLLASFLAQRIAGPVRSLVDRAASVGQGRMPGPPLPGIWEVNRAGDALAEAAAERAKAERAARDNAAQLALIADAMPALIAFIDADQRYRFNNKAYEDWIGRSREAIHGRRMDEVLGEAAYMAVRPYVEAALAGKRVRYETFLVYPDGRGRHIEVTYVPRVGDDGRVEGIYALVLDVSERKRTEEHQRLLLNELNHRVKNTLASIQSVAMQTLRSADNTANAGESLQARLLALSRAHNLLTSGQWQDASLRDIADAATAPFRNGGSAIAFEGKDVRLGAKAAVALSMAFHELATNAVKYGALSEPAGTVSISWSLHGANGKHVLTLEWIERNGPPVPVPAPARTGFGSRLIRQGIAHELEGEVELAFDPAGVRCRIVFPL